MNTRNRQLTAEERQLVRQMLESAAADGQTFLSQLGQAEVTPWKCECGCASINFEIRGRDPAPPGVNIIADFVYGDDATLCGIFVFASDKTLSGLEVYGLAVDAPTKLPRFEELRPLHA